MCAAPKPEEKPPKEPELTFVERAKAKMVNMADNSTEKLNDAMAKHEERRCAALSRRSAHVCTERCMFGCRWLLQETH
jgi:hypothetical protein